MQKLTMLSTAAIIAANLGCQPDRGDAPSTTSMSAGTAASSPQPMAAFARFIGGHWKMTTTAGRDTYDTWACGPGKQSIRSMRVGTLTNGDPWRAMTVYYWHPTLKEVRLLSVGSVMRGVGEGTIRFEGETAESVFTLNQTGGPRHLRERWTFAGPDKYHDDLSEKVRGKYELLTGWDRVRVEMPGSAEPVAAPFLAPGNTPSDLMRPLARVLGQAWASITATGGAAPRTEGQSRTRTTFEYVPHADAISGRVEVTGADGVSSHVMDVYLYHHTGTRGLRVLALGSDVPNDVSVYEGDIVPAADGTSLAIQLTEHRSTATRALEARTDFEKDGTARVQVWRLNGQERTMAMDRRYSRARE